MTEQRNETARARGRMLDGRPTIWFRRPPADDPGYSIDASDGGRLYRNGELVGYAEKIAYDRDVNGWWIHYEALPGRWLDRLTKFAGS